MKIILSILAGLIIFVLFLGMACQPAIAATTDIKPLEGFFDTDLFQLDPEDAWRARLYLGGGFNADSTYELYLSGAYGCDPHDSMLALYFPNNTLRIGDFDPYWEGATTPSEKTDKAVLDFESTHANLTYNVYVGEGYQNNTPGWLSVGVRNNQTKHTYRYFHNTVYYYDTTLSREQVQYQDAMELGWEFERNSWHFNHFLAAGRRDDGHLIYGLDLNARDYIGAQSLQFELKYEDLLNDVDRHLNLNFYWYGSTGPYYYGTELKWNGHRNFGSDDLSGNNSDYKIYIAKYFWQNRFRLQLEYGGYADFLDSGNNEIYYRPQWHYTFSNKFAYDGQLKFNYDDDTRFTHTLIFDLNLKNHLELSYSNQVYSDYTMSSSYSSYPKAIRLSWKYNF